MSDASFKRECVRGHGALEGIAETFGLPLTKGFAMARTEYTQAEPTGRVLPVKVWRCPNYGYLELVNL